MSKIPLDIETIPGQAAAVLEALRADAEAEKAECRAPGNYKDPEKIAANIAEQHAAIDAAVMDKWRKTSFDGAFGQIAVVSFAIDGGEPVKVYRDDWQAPGAEAALLEELRDAMHDRLNPKTELAAQIIGHMMTSMTKHEGRPVYTIDQIQSDWGQKLRDGGVRDEAKIAELKATLKAKYAEHNPKLQDWMEFWKSLGDKANGQGGTGFLPNGSAGDTAGLIRGAQNWYDSYNYILTDAQKKDFRAKIMQIEYARRDLQLPESELATAEASASGHPLVNTTDQWTTTTLRRAIRQAAEADAEYIAIPHGDTVLSYNPGKDEGMAGFYGTRTMEGIVPKNLRKLLEKLDKESPRSQRVETLDTPSGKRGWQSGTSNPFDKSQTGFTLFPLTEKVKQAVMDGGLPTFASGGRVPAPSPLPDMPVNKDRAISRALAWIKIGK
jgi:hypothetical protein